MKKKWIFLVVTILILIFLCIWFLFYNPFLKLSLIGEKQITVVVGDQLVDPGVKASWFSDSIKVETTGTVDTQRVGTYVIKYEARKYFTRCTLKRTVVVVDDNAKTTNDNVKASNDEATYINGILLVNKIYGLPSTFGNGNDETASKALKKLQKDAAAEGYDIPLVSGFRSYDKQVMLYNDYVAKDGVEKADTYSARPGYSEHQTGLTFDIGAISDTYGETKEGTWLRERCHEYGFIIRYPKGKEAITGYQYEPWHVRYVGREHATSIYKQNITLEEYLGVK